MSHTRASHRVSPRLLVCSGLPGPLGRIGVDPPVGFYVLIAETEDEARAIADSDPMHASGLKTYDLKLWSLHESSIIGVGVRASLNGTDSEHSAYWPDMLEEHAKLPVPKPPAAEGSS